MAQTTQTTLRPLYDRVLVKRLEEGDAKRGSILIPDTAKEKSQGGKVIAVGTGTVTDEGQRPAAGAEERRPILFGKYSGSEIQLNGEDYLIMKEEDVLGILGA